MKFLLALLVAGVCASSAIAVIHKNPTPPQVTPLGNASVDVKWSGISGTTVRIKRDTFRQGYAQHIYNTPNDGDEILTDQPLGEHTYRICEISGLTTYCSAPVLVNVT
jgi:hypothetical protein